MLLALSLACNDDDEGSGIIANFAPALREPGPKQVYLALDQTRNELVGVSVRVRATDGIASADLTLQYDPSLVLFRSWEPGTLLEEGGSAVDYEVAETVSGFLRIQIAVSDPDVAVDAGADSPPLVRLGFSLIRTGSSATSFVTGSAIEDRSGAAIPEMEFLGGDFIGV
jgi:hypothetical protein